MDDSLPPPQDRQVDRRTFLRRLGALSAGAIAGIAPPISLRGARLGTPVRGYDAQSVERFYARDARVGIPARVDGPAELTAREAGVLIRSGELTPSELVADCLARIERWDPTYLAFNEVPAEAVRRRAAELDRLAPTGLLHGIPLAVKDNFYTRGVRTTANSRVYEDFVPEFDATAVVGLTRAGAVVLGKTQMGPLATTRALTPDGRITTVSAWAPFSPEVSPGGSSSGSATAVAARMATAAIGTQTGGSITSPALAQGLTGLKPTLGRVSLRGVIPLSYTRDHAGPLARDAGDAALLLQAMAGPDPLDPRSIGLPPVPDYLTAATPVERGGRPGLRWPTRIGVPPDWVEGGGEALAADRATFLREVEGLGAEFVELVLPPAWEEVTSSAFNAVRLPERTDLFMEALTRDVRLFGVALSPWINGLLLSADQYLKGQRARMELLRLVHDHLFARCDLVIQSRSGPFDMVGLPLLAFPIGMRTRDEIAIPHGVILGGLPFGEERLLSLAAAWQTISDWHGVRPEALTETEARLPSFDRPERGRLGIDEVTADAE